MKTKALRVLGSSVIGALLLSAVPALASTISLLPSGDGNYTQFTPSTGTTHNTLVNESVCDGTTSYNSTSVVGNRDSYTISLSGIPDTAKITSIAIKPCASRASSGGTNPVANVFYRWNGLNSSDSGSYSLTGTTPSELATTTYSSLSHTKSSSSTLEIGAVLTSSTKGIRLSRLATEITYSYLEAPTNLTGIATTSASSTPAVQLTWTDNSTTETNFIVEGKVGSVWKAIATTTANTTLYTDSSFASTTGTYTHRVRAWNGTLFSSYSNIATTTIP
jgi:hypothetical protein